ncbi:MAG: glycosyl transferase family 90 [Thermoanaerobaculia bacterium]
MKTIFFALTLALGLAAPAIPSGVASPQPIHLAVVACGGSRLDETTVMLKSAVLSTRSPLALHIFADDAVRPRLERSLWAWPDWVRQRLTLTFYPISSPGCGSQRLFFPDLIQGTGRVLAVAPDVIFLRPVDELWSQFAAFQPKQIAAMPDSAGVVLMDLDRMRQAGWREWIKSRTGGDQELIDLFFREHPEKLQALSCAWGFRSDHCRPGSACKLAAGESVGVVQGGLAGFYKDGLATYKALYEAFLAYPFGEDLKTDLVEPLRARFAVADPAEACAPARERFLESLARQGGLWKPEPLPEVGAFHDVAVAQLAPWREKGIRPEDLERVRKLAMPTIRYQILGGKLYRAPACTRATRCPGIDHFLVKIAPLVPDVEFFVNPNDYPATGILDPLPVFSFSKIPAAHGDILYPVWAFWHDDPWLGVVPHWRWNEMSRELLEAGAAVPWEKKKPVVFFRGGLTSPLREPYTLYSVTHRDQWDVRFTPHPSPKFMARVAELKQEVAEPVPPRDHCAYRYLLNVDGISSTHRLRMMMACGGLVLYVQPTWMEFYYYKLVPWKHFVPLPLDPAEGQRVLDFLVAHDELAQRIARNGREFIEKELTLEEVDRYWADLLKEYAALQRFQPQKDPGFVAVEKAED